MTRAEKSRREHRTVILVLTALEVPVLLMLIFGTVFDNDSLRVAAYAMGMPVTFALLANVGLYLTWPSKS